MVNPNEQPLPIESGSPYGQIMPSSHIQEWGIEKWDTDRIEGESIEQLKWSAQEAFPEPSIYVPDNVASNLSRSASPAASSR